MEQATTIAGVKAINELRPGQFFTFKYDEQPSEKIVWVYDGYNRSTRKYTAHKYSDVSHFIEKKKGYPVFTEFIF